ncbi:MAG: hypothetical protein ACLVCA_04035 [Peptoniphilus sp.]|uniref:hypothetical protein n=1 Tax=Peptoniphilus sp. TaxID=1971214 RepID=UPI00399A46E5
MRKKNNKKKRKKLFALLIILFLCFPISYRYKYGRTVSYKAILYSYTIYYRLEVDETYYTGREFLIFPLII